MVFFDGVTKAQRKLTFFDQTSAATDTMAFRVSQNIYSKHLWELRYKSQKSIVIDSNSEQHLTVYALSHIFCLHLV